MHKGKIFNFVVRHLSTVDERINYDKSYKEIRSTVKSIRKVAKDYNVEDIKIYTSSEDRTLLTSLILYIKLKEKMPEVKIRKPELNSMIERDPKRSRSESIKKYFKEKNKFKDSKKSPKIIIYVTHSSCYRNICRGLILGITVDIKDIEAMLKEMYICDHAVSLIDNFCPQNIYYNKK